jgi:hypothetical protein
MQGPNESQVDDTTMREQREQNEFTIYSNKHFTPV